MGADQYAKLSRRERQIMDILYRRNRASVREVLAELPDPPSYSACRALLRILGEKGHVKHRKVGASYVYSPKVSQKAARRSALQRVVDTFFDGSAQRALVALLDKSDFSEDELDELSTLIDETKKRGGAS